MYGRTRSAALGRLEVSPSAFPSDSNQSFLLTYTAGATAIVTGGEVRLLTPRVFSQPNTLRARGGGPGWGAGFTEVVECPSRVEVALTVEPPVWGHWVTTDIVLKVAAGRVEPGERIVVRYGGARSKVSVAKMAGRVYAFRALVDPDGARRGPHGGYTFVANDAPLETLPREALRLEAYVPSTLLGPNGPVDSGADAEPGDGPAAALVVLKDAAHNVVATRTVEKTAAECRPFGSAEAGVRRIEVRDLEAGTVGVTNPWRLVAPGEPRLYWGDLHVHTRISDDASAERTLDDATDFARDAMGHDFVAVTDHVHNVRAEEWQSTVTAARRATVSGRFVALAGFEFNSREQPSGRRLDRNVYFAGLEGAALPAGVSRDDYRAMTTAELAEWIDPARHLLIPHQHNGGLWDARPAAKMRLVEIYSHWGCFERPGCERPFATGQYPAGAFVSEALDAGVRLGFVGGSDTHSAHPGNDFHWPHGNMAGGLTAVWAPELTPRSVFGALAGRSTYATTRARIWLRFAVNGAPMGAELAAPAAGEPRHVVVEVHGTAPLAEVTIIRSGTAVRTWEPDDWDLVTDYTDELPVSARGWEYYYVRVKQRDSEMAWSSPVWIGAVPD